MDSIATMIVDDEPDIRMLMREQVGIRGFVNKRDIGQLPEVIRAVVASD